MFILPRVWLALFSLLFALHYPVLGLFWLSDTRVAGLSIVCMLFYLAALLPSVLLYRGKSLPMAQIYANLAVSVFVPLLSLMNIEPNAKNLDGTYVTWFVGGIATLLAITALRGGSVIAWVGTVLLIAQVVIWGGWTAFQDTGLVGALLIVSATDAISRGYDSTTEKMQTYLTQASQAAAQTARTTAVRTERKVRVEAALRNALPVLQRIIDANGKLKPEDRIEASLTEAALRDEIHGKNLLDDGVRIAAREARRRGVEVSIVDDGGMDGADQFGALAIRTSIAQAIASTNEGTISIRSPKNETFMVSITANRPGATHPDLWLRLP